MLRSKHQLDLDSQAVADHGNSEKMNSEIIIKSPSSPPGSYVNKKIRESSSSSGSNISSKNTSRSRPTTPIDTSQDNSSNLRPASPVGSQETKKSFQLSFWSRSSSDKKIQKPISPNSSPKGPHSPTSPKDSPISVPDEYKDPNTHLIMVEPYFCILDCKTYEKITLESDLESNRQPKNCAIKMSEDQSVHDVMYPNVNLKQAIQRYLTLYPELRKDYTSYSITSLEPELRSIARNKSPVK